MTDKELFILAYRMAEARLRKPGTPVFSEAEILEDFPLQRPEVSSEVLKLILEGLTYGN